jgi:prephenate dehydrogenase
MKFAIIGGTRGLGEWIARFLKSKGFSVVITGRDQISGNHVSKKLGVDYSPDNKKAASNSDVVIIAVPIDITEDVIREVAPYLKKGSLLMDVTSVKEKPALLMNELVREGVDFLPAHPMFGPRIRSLDGQVVVLTPLKKSDWYFKVLNFLENEKSRVLVTTPQKHDKMMSVVQVLTHFAYISIAFAIEKLEVDIKESRKFASPIYSLMVDTISRIVAQNPYLAYSIQVENLYANETREKFFEAITEMKEMLSQEDQQGFVKAMSSAAKNLDDLEAALGRSDKAISVLNQEISILKESVGKEVGVRNIYSGKIHFGTLLNLSPDLIELNVGKKIVNLKTANVEVLTATEVWEHKLETLERRKYDVSAIFPDNCNAEIIASAIGNINGIIQTDVMDIYQGPQIDSEKVSITFRFEVLKPKLVIEVENLLKGFGATIR